MSLNPEQRRTTADEFTENLSRAGLTLEQAQARSSLSEQRFSAAISVSPDAHPVDVWAVRDLLEDLVEEAGGTSVEHSVLNDKARSAAQVWFGIPDKD